LNIGANLQKSLETFPITAWFFEEIAVLRRFSRGNARFSVFSSEKNYVIL